MIISHAHRFVFIKTKKTAGTSIEIELSKHCGPEDIITPMQGAPEDEILRVACGGRGAQNFSRRRELIDAYQIAASCGNLDEMRKQTRQLGPEDYRSHMSVSKVRKLSGPLDDYFWFTVERDPCDRIISFIYWTKKPDKPLSPARRMFYVMKYAPSAKFQNFHLYAVRGKVGVDEIINYDRLERDFGLICGKIGIAAPEQIIATKNSSRKCRSTVLSRLERAFVQFHCSNEMASLSAR